MRVLLAGAGLIGKRHLGHLQNHDRLTLAGVIDPLKMQTNTPKFDDIDDVDLDADAIVIATPNDMHVKHAQQAAARGWHMLVEKPVATDMDGARQIAKVAKEAGVKVLVGHHRRHYSAVQKLKTMIDQGRIGTPVAVSLIWSVRKPDDYFAGNWRQGKGGSPVMINLPHEIDMLRFIFGEITDVAGFGSMAQRGAGRLESGAVALGFASGMTATISFADTAPCPWSFEAATGENLNIATGGQDNLKIMGTTGSLSFPSMRVWQGSNSWADPQYVKTEIFEENTPLIAQLDHFADVIAGDAPPMIDAEDAAKSLDVTLQIEDILFKGAYR